jgi:hypothetical protein
MAECRHTCEAQCHEKKDRTLWRTVARLFDSEPVSNWQMTKPSFCSEYT